VKIDASRVAASLHIDYRQKGLLWFSTYKVDFDGAYTFQNPTAREEEFVIQLPFPAQQAVYDNVQLLLDDKPLAVTFSRVAGRGADSDGGGREVRAACGVSFAGAGQLAVHVFTRERRGVDCARQRGRKRERNFAGARLSIAGENGFLRFRFPGQFTFADGKTADGERLGAGVELSESGVRIRHRVEDAAEAATRTAGGKNQLFRARVAVLLFLFGVYPVHAARQRSASDELFFLACAFFAFHLLLAYLADHISIHAAFLIRRLFRSYSWSATCAWWWIAIRHGGGGADATDLPGVVFVRVFSLKGSRDSGDDGKSSRCS